MTVVIACRAARMLLRAVALWALLWQPHWVWAGPDEAARAIAVIYPDIGEPYRSVFSAIIAGVEDRARARVISVAVGPNSTGQDISGDLRRREVRSVIALGRIGLKVASSMDRGIGVVAGGVLSVPESEAQGLSVYSLAPDPALMFARLKSLMPAARRVIVVYDPRQNAWLIRLAREAARANGLELVAFEADDLKSAIRNYKDVLSSVDVRRDVLWLPQDSTTVEDSTVLPMVLRDAWEQNLAVFSSNVTHVKRGALFALYPDNAELGRALAGWALGYASTGAMPPKGVQPLKDVLVAVNTRTANHLGINLTSSQLRFNMVYPEP